MNYLKVFILFLGLYFIPNCSGTPNVQNRESLSKSGYDDMDSLHYNGNSYNITWYRPIYVPNKDLNDNNNNNNNGKDDFAGLDNSDFVDGGHGDDENSQRLGLNISESSVRYVLQKNYGEIPNDQLIYIDNDDIAGDVGACGENCEPEENNGKHIPIDEVRYYNDDEIDESYEGESNDLRNPVRMYCECPDEDAMEDNYDEYNDEDCDEEKDEDKDEKLTARIRIIKPDIL